ncbi:hypothetical protein AB0K15_46125 [Amycolatopsis sp. NPDC049253]|uniref:hypothetical protein n=1 Tax=Amycolatopsis sp. NPDC049253 TaxID=3155274 RepID=UPI00344195AC
MLKSFGPVLREVIGDAQYPRPPGRAVDEVAERRHGGRPLLDVLPQRVQTGQGSSDVQDGSDAHVRVTAERQVQCPRLV